MVLYISCTYDFEPNISAKKCGLYTSFYGTARSRSLPYTEMYPGFQIWESSGPLLEKFGSPLQNFGGPAN